MPIDQEALRRARRIIADTPIMRFLAFEPATDAPPDVYAVEMPVTADTLNPLGSAHGGAVATLVDHTGGFGAGLLTGRTGPTADLHIRFLAAARTGTCRAEARVVRAGGRLIVVDVRVTVDGDLVATASLTVVPVADDPRS